MRIVSLERAGAGGWDEFVAGREDATFFHQSGMPGLIASVFGHRDRSMVALRGDEVVGVLPLVELRTRLFGHALISLPFCVYAGPLACDEEAIGALLEEAGELRSRIGADRVEIRGLDASAATWSSRDPEWRAREGLYATFRRAISADDDANLRAIPRKQRAVLRKGIERGLASATGGDGGTVRAAWRIYARSVRDLGSPVFPRRWFEGLAATFPGQVDATLVSEAGRAMSAVLSFRWRNEVLPYYGGGVPAARACQAYDVLYWQVMREAARRGATLFDFGRSKQGSGAYAFKKNWGFAPTPLAYRFLVRPGGAIPEHNPLNPRYRTMISAWKRLPLPVANVLGPHLVRGVG